MWSTINKKQEETSSSASEERVSTYTNSSIPLGSQIPADPNVLSPFRVSQSTSTQSDGIATNTEFGSNAGFAGATGNAIGTNNTVNFNRSYNIRLGEFPNAISFFQYAAKPFVALSRNRNRGRDPVEIRDILPLDPPSAPPSSIADMYTRSMLECLAGYPLYNPKPLSELSKEYLLNGVNVGDVGFVRADGAFDFLFNICPSQKDLINPPDLPDGFCLRDYSATRDLESLPHNTSLISQTVTKTESGEYICKRSEGAILVLPEGAVQDEAMSIMWFKGLAKLHGVQWYEYTLTRGRDISNGSLYLVTSFTKCTRWGIGVFDRPSNQGQGLTFVNSPFGWKGSGAFRTKVSNPNQGDIPNQCVFLRGYKIMIRQDIFDNLCNNQLCGSNAEMPSSSASLQAGSGSLGLTLVRQRATRIRGGGGTDLISRIPTGGNLLTLSTAPTMNKSDKVVLNANFNSSPVHPSDLINSALLSENPDAKIALTHDDIWCELMQDNFPELNYATLINMAKSYTSIVDEYGCVALEYNAGNVLNESLPIQETETPDDARDVRNLQVSIPAQASTRLLQLPTLQNVQIRSTRDALQVFYAVAMNRLPLVTQRLNAKERRAIVGGNVYVWEERGANTEPTGLGMERWTDGMKWGPSRVRGEFLLCHQEKSDAMEELLIKQTYTVLVLLPADRPRGIFLRKWHLTSYFSQQKLASLDTIDSIPLVGNAIIPDGWFQSAQRVKNNRRESQDYKTATWSEED